MNSYNKLHSYITSQEYKNDMLYKVDNEKDFFNYLHDAEPSTENYKFRHGPNAVKMGAWRWKGIFTHLEKFKSLLFDSNLKGVDLGGASNPISPILDIVDIQPTDLYGNKVKYSSLKDIPKPIDFIYSSHTLEHILDLDQIVSDMFKSLKPQGILALNLPSYSCKRWRANGGHIHKGLGGTPHLHTFKLSSTKVNEVIDSLVDIDSILIKHKFNITLAEYTGDDSIVIFAQKP